MSASSILLPKPATEVESSKKERLLTRGFGVLLALAVYLPLQEKIAYRSDLWLPGWPIVTAVTNVLLLAGIICLFLVSSVATRSATRVQFLTVAFLGVGFFYTLGFVTAQIRSEGIHFWDDFADWRRWASILLLYFFTLRFLRNRKQVMALLYAMTLVLAFAGFNLLRENFSSGLSLSLIHI